MPHPGDDGRFSPLLDSDSFGPGNRAATHRRGVIGNRTGEPVGKISMIGMEG